MLSKLAIRAGLLVAGAMVVQGGFLAVGAQETTLKIAVVDLEQVFLLSTVGKALQSKLEKFQKQVQTEGESLTEKANQIRKQVAEGGQSLTDARLAELQKQYEDQITAIRRFRDDKQREGEKMKNDGLQKIEQQLQPVFKKFNDERGYDLILNNVAGVVVMAGDKLDITAEIVQRLNAATAGGG